jgi:hypothetical protein
VVERWVQDQYGIKNFMNLAREHFPNLSRLEVRPFLAPPVAATTVGEVAFVATVKSRKLKPFALTLGADHFHSGNAQKRALLCPRYRQTRRSQEVRRLAEPAHNEGVPFNQVGTLNTIGLKQAWQHEREATFPYGLYDELDLSTFWEECLMQSDKPPAFVFGLNGKATRTSTEGGLDPNKRWRPPAEWFEPLLMALCMSGHLIWCRPEYRFSPYESRLVTTQRRITKETSIEPLVVIIGHDVPEYFVCRPALISKRYLTENKDPERSWTEHCEALLRAQ